MQMADVNKTDETENECRKNSLRCRNITLPKCPIRFLPVGLWLAQFGGCWQCHGSDSVMRLTTLREGGKGNLHCRETRLFKQQTVCAKPQNEAWLN